MSVTLQGSYDPSQVTVIVGGVILSGFADGDFITCEREEDNFFKRVGGDGQVGRARNANKSGSFTFTLMATSPANEQLSALLAVDDLVNDGLLVFPIAVYDGSGKDLAVATQCWLKKLPNLVKGKEVGDREWIFDAADMKIFVGGNAN